MYVYFGFLDIIPKQNKPTEKRLFIKKEEKKE